MTTTVKTKAPQTIIGGPEDKTNVARPPVDTGGTPPLPPPGEPHKPEAPAFSPQDLANYKKLYKDIRAHWAPLVQLLVDLKEAQFNSPADFKAIGDGLMNFAKYMSNILKEIEGLGKSDTLRATVMLAKYSGNIMLASPEEYKFIVDHLDEMVSLFDKHMPDFEKLAKSSELDDHPLIKVSDLKIMHDTLDHVADLLVKNKDNISKNMGGHPTENDPDKTNIIHTEVKGKAMTAKAAINDAVRRLVEAANRLDLRAPTQRSKEQLAELLSYMKALRECYQAMHWVSRGEPYYADHKMFSDIYDMLVTEIDALAEKAIGYTDDAYVVEVQYQTARIAAHVTEIMSFLPDMTNIQCLLNAEKKLSKEIVPKMLNDLEQAGELSDGLENFIQSIADNHEKIIYHLQRRLKTQKDLSELGPVEPNISPPPEPTQDVDNEFDNMVDEEEQQNPGI